MTSERPEMHAAREWIRAQEEALTDVPTSPVFPPAEYRARQDAVRSMMERERLDVIVVTSPDATCWLHGYDSRWYRSHSSTSMPPTHATIVRQDSVRLTMIETGAHEHLVRLTSVVDDFVPVPGSGFEVEPTLGDFVGFLAETVVRRVGVRVGVERWSSVPNPATLAAMEASMVAAGAEVVDISAPLRALRRVKSPAEIALIERAQAACDAGVRAVQGAARLGVTPLELWTVYMAASVAAGGEPTAMHETIAAGAPMPMLHLTSPRTPLAAGDYFHADMASAVHRYHARATRPLTLGVPAPEVAEITQVLAGALDVVIDVAQVGVPFSEVGSAIAAYSADVGLDVWVGGYELGLSFPPDWVGEFTWGGVDCGEAIVEDGLVTNIESCGFLALVDTVVFETTGPRLLSSLPRDVLVCGDAQ